MRHRSIRDELIRAQARDLAIGALSNGRVETVYRPTKEQMAIGHDLVGSDPERALAAGAALRERMISPGEIVAKAYAQVSNQLEIHEKKLAELETRRRRLREDYDRLRAAQRQPVEDAEVIL